MKNLVYGSLNIDLIFSVDHIVRPGETIGSKALERGAGGKGANQAAALAKAGLETFMAGKIGADGEFLLELLQSYGVNTDLVARYKGATGQALIQLDSAGQNAILLFPGGNARIEAPEIRRSLAGTVRLTGQASLSTGLVPEGWDALRALLGREIGAITLNSLDVAAKADKGVVNLDPIRLDGPVLRGNGKGVVDLPADTINLRFTARIGKTDLPVWIEGPLGKPDYGLDAAALIKDRLDQPAVKKQIQRGTKEVERGVDRLLKKLR
jgi:hypothetical protein